MRITAIKNQFMRVARQNWHFVRVETDQGLVGVGEASLEGRELTVAAAVDDLGRRLIGQDPGMIEHHWQVLHRHGFWRGGVVLDSALSAIEQALWDIKGKKLGAPVHELFGGPTRQRIRLYTHSGGRDPQAAADHARAMVELGFTALKTGPSPREHVDERQMIRDMAAKLEAIRLAVGDEVDLMVDNHGRMSPVYAIEMARAIAPYKLLFFEEPVPPENVDALGKVAEAKADVPLATGERLFTKWEYRELLEKQLVDVVQPDICHAGGIAELRKIAAMAEVYHVQVAPHNPNGPIATAASAHLAASIPNFLILEYAMQEPHRTEAVRSGPKVERGWMELPTAPGLGVELDEAAIAKYPYGPRDYSEAYYRDGAVADI